MLITTQRSIHGRFLVFVSFLFVSLFAEGCKAPSVGWKVTRVDASFRSEGVAVADVNRDGKLDVLAGEVWYEAPSWKMREVYWYENPRGQEQHWKQHLVWHSACNETPVYEDLFGDGQRVLVMGWQPEGKSKQGQMSWFRPGPDPTQLWEMHPISTPSGPDREVPGTQTFSHGLGVGDLDGDGRFDVLCTGGWWKQPEKVGAGPWEFRRAGLGEVEVDGKTDSRTYGCANMFAVDVDGDGLADVISSSAHRFGIWWYRQEPGSNGSQRSEERTGSLALRHISFTGTRESGSSST